MLALIDWPTSIASIAAAITAGLAFIQSKRNGVKQKETHDLINSRLTAMLAAAQQIGHAEGVIDGLAQAKEAAKESVLAVAKAAAVQVLAEAEAIRIKKESDHV
jgi:hypothetical protein